MTGPLIVVGVDGSPGAQHALEWAISRAEDTGGTIRAVMSWEYPALALLPPPLGLPVPPAERMDEATAAALTQFVEPVRAGTDVEVTEIVRHGAAAQVLLHEADTADLLVVGSRGRGRVASVVLGSVSRTVASGAPCPAAIVPGSGTDHAGGPVVVGVDGSATSLAALRWAGQSTQGPIHALHVFEYPFGPEYAIDGFEWDDPHDLGRQLLERSVAEVLGDRPDVTLTATEGDPRDVLVEVGRDASMIVLGARGVGGAALGSITAGVASSAQVPVVVVPSD